MLHLGIQRSRHLTCPLAGFQVREGRDLGQRLQIGGGSGTETVLGRRELQVQRLRAGSGHRYRVERVREALLRDSAARDLHDHSVHTLETLPANSTPPDIALIP